MQRHEAETAAYDEIGAMFAEEPFPEAFQDELTVRLMCNPNPHAVSLGCCLKEKRGMTRERLTQLVEKFGLEWTRDLKWDQQTQTMTVVPFPMP